MAVPVHMCATSSYNVRHPKKSNMAAGKPEVVTSTLIVKIFEQFQRVWLCLHARSFQPTRQQYNTTTPDTRKIQYGGEKYGSNQFLASVLDFLVSDVVGRCSAHVHWNGHVRKNIPSLWNFKNILIRSGNITTSGFRPPYWIFVCRPCRALSGGIATAAIGVAVP